MTEPLADTAAILTAARSGIGAATARALAFVGGGTVDVQQTLFGGGFAIENPDEVRATAAPDAGADRSHDASLFRPRPVGATMNQPLDGTAAIVTGASSGIGAAIARALAREGADVALAARRAQRLEKLAEAIEADHAVQAAPIPTDVTDENAVGDLVDEAVDRFGGLDLLVNNAGVAHGNRVQGMGTDDYRGMMDVNCDGMFYAAREALPHLRDSEGQLVFVASFAGKHPRPYNPVYAATKWWTRGFAKSLAAEVGEDVAVTIVNPAATRTEFTVEGITFEERFDPGEVVEPEEVADAIAFAAKQDPSMIHEIDVFNRDKFVGF